MDQGLKLAGHIFKFIINKSINMKTGEDKMKKSASSSTTSKVVGSLVAGAAVGLAAGILLAPEKGKKTRAKLMEDAKDLTSKLKNKTNDLKEKASDLKEKANDGIDAVTAKE